MIVSQFRIFDVTYIKPLILPLSFCLSLSLSVSPTIRQNEINFRHSPSRRGTSRMLCKDHARRRCCSIRSYYFCGTTTVSYGAASKNYCEHTDALRNINEHVVHRVGHREKQWNPCAF